MKRPNTVGKRPTVGILLLYYVNTRGIFKMCSFQCLFNIKKGETFFNNDKKKSRKILF